MRSVLLSLAILLLAGVAFGEPIPDTGAGSITDFVSGDTISSSAVNTNFDNVETAVDDNASDIDALQSQISEVSPEGADVLVMDGILTTDGSGSFDKYLPANDSPYLTGSIASPFTNGNYKMYSNFAFDGIKARCVTDGLGPGLNGDPAKPWETDCVGSSAEGTVEKTKTTGFMMRQHVTTAGENFAQQLTQVTGGDSDSITLHVRQFSMGGSQTGGDEGSTNIRISNQDYYWTGEGTAVVPATTGEFDLNFANRISSQDYSVAVAEGKLIVFTGATPATTQTVPSGDDTYRPPGTTKLNETASPGYGGTGHLSNTYNWTLDAQLPAGVEAGWCFADDATQYISQDNVTTHHWLRISGVNAGRTAFSTEYWSQSVDNRYPSGYQWSGNYRYAPCAHIVNPIYDTAPGFETNAAGARIYKTTDWTSGGAPVAFQIPAYGEHKMVGVRLISASNLPVATKVYGYEAVNKTGFTGTTKKGRFQHDAAFVASVSGNISNNRSTSDLDDGTYHAWDSGLLCLDNSCRVGMKYEFQDGHQGNASAAISVDPPNDTGNWGEDNSNYLSLIDVEGESLLDLNLSHDDGLMQGTDPLVSESDIDTLSELNTIVSDATLVSENQIDTLSDLNTIVSDATLTQTIASGQQAMPTGSLIAANQCVSTAPTTATGVASTDVVNISFSGSTGDPTLINGYGPGASDGLAIYVWPTTNNINFKVCNLKSSGITPGALTVNYRVTR